MSEFTEKVSIITVNFNQPEATEALLDSIRINNAYPHIEIIVIDNGSTSNPVPGWQMRYPGVLFIRSEQNKGFAGGNNIGIKAAKGSYLFLVNNDTEFTKGLVPTLLQTMRQHPEAGIVSPKIRYYQSPDTLQYAGFTRMNYYTARNACIGQFEKDRGQYDDRTGETAFAHGAAMLVRTSALEQTGLMKENYFLYYEEMDWCESFKRNGYTIRVNMQALIYHKESLSVGQRSPLKEYFMNRNRILFIRRNAGFFQKLFFTVYFMLVVAPRNLLQYRKEKLRGFGKQLFRAIGWNMTHSVNSEETGYKPI